MLYIFAPSEYDAAHIFVPNPEKKVDIQSFDTWWRSSII